MRGVLVAHIWGCCLLVGSVLNSRGVISSCPTPTPWVALPSSPFYRQGYFPKAWPLAMAAEAGFKPGRQLQRPGLSVC